MYQALYRKYRPRVFDDVVGQSHITETLKNQLVSGHLSHAYLFTGTRGTGKTTCAKILARAVNCENPQNGNPCNCCPSCLGIESGSIPDVLEIDAASNNGVDNIRALRDDSIYSPATVKKRVYIVDEVHMLSTSAFNALLKIMEEPPEHLMFILATTELNKVPATILSRCQRFNFRRITAANITERLVYVAQQESIALEPAAASLLARLSDGALRDALSLMDQCTGSGGSLATEDIYNTLGLAGNIKTAAIMDAVGRGDTSKALGLFSGLYSSGKDIAALFSELSSLCRDLLMLKTVGDTASLIGGYDDETLKKLSARFSFEALMNAMTVLQSVQSGLSGSANRRADAELCLLHLCDPAASGDNSALAARVSHLEKQLKELKLSSGSAAPQPQQEESAPWDDSDSPPLPDDNDAPPPSVSEPAVPKKSVTQVPTKDEAKPKSGFTSVDFWPALVEAIKPKVDIPTGMYLSNGELCSAQRRGDELLVAASNPFVLNMISKSSTGELIAEQAETHMGFRPAVRFVNTSELQPAEDKLDGLIKKATGFDNIKII